MRKLIRSIGECLRAVILREFAEWSVFMLLTTLSNGSGESELVHCLMSSPAVIGELLNHIKR